jgi:hypothetical protein
MPARVAGHTHRIWAKLGSADYPAAAVVRMKPDDDRVVVRLADGTQTVAVLRRADTSRNTDAHRLDPAVAYDDALLPVGGTGVWLVSVGTTGPERAMLMVDASTLPPTPVRAPVTPP